MALTNETISAGRSNNASIKNNCSKMIDYCIDVDSIIKGNADFQVFSEKTGFGDTIGKSLNDLFLLIKTNVSKSIEQITNETDRFLNYQEELNRAKTELNFDNSQRL